MGTLSSTNRKPDSPRARPGHRAVSIRMDCVLVLFLNCLKRALPTDILKCISVSVFMTFANMLISISLT